MCCFRAVASVGAYEQEKAAQGPIMHLGHSDGLTPHPHPSHRAEFCLGCPTWGCCVHTRGLWEATPLPTLCVCARSLGHLSLAQCWGSLPDAGGCFLNLLTLQSKLCGLGGVQHINTSHGSPLPSGRQESPSCGTTAHWSLLNLAEQPSHR